MQPTRWRLALLPSNELSNTTQNNPLSLKNPVQFHPVLLLLLPSAQTKQKRKKSASQFSSLLALWFFEEASLILNRRKYTLEKTHQASFFCVRVERERERGLFLCARVS
jgi:hypothetical protein